MNNIPEEKQRFLVAVNFKWVVTIEACSMGGAEHYILDKCHFGIEQCQAFEKDQASLLFEMFPEVETTTFSVILKYSKKLEADNLEEKAREMLKKAAAIREEYN